MLPVRVDELYVNEACVLYGVGIHQPGFGTSCSLGTWVLPVCRTVAVEYSFPYATRDVELPLFE
jgi:hypothetical protein